jgi:hypothetical protein
MRDGTESMAGMVTGRTRTLLMAVMRHSVPQRPPAREGRGPDGGDRRWGPGRSGVGGRGRAPGPPVDAAERGVPADVGSGVTVSRRAARSTSSGVGEVQTGPFVGAAAGALPPAGREADRPDTAPWSGASTGQRRWCPWHWALGAAREVRRGWCSPPVGSSLQRSGCWGTASGAPRRCADRWWRASRATSASWRPVSTSARKPQASHHPTSLGDPINRRRYLRCCTPIGDDHYP